MQPGCCALNFLSLSSTACVHSELLTALCPCICCYFGLQCLPPVFSIWEGLLLSQALTWKLPVTSPDRGIIIRSEIPTRSLPCLGRSLAPVLSEHLSITLAQHCRIYCIMLKWVCVCVCVWIWICPSTLHALSSSSLGTIWVHVLGALASAWYIYYCSLSLQ